MPVLILHSADHRRDLVDGAKARWPVGDSQSGAVARHERADNDQQEDVRGQKCCEPVQGRVVPDDFTRQTQKCSSAAQLELFRREAQLLILSAFHPAFLTRHQRLQKSRRALYH